ncbi:MAG TPA: hypothetical protein VGX78_10865 [Pirellulales bacterium]|jgi:hypothetical protein|nr:hypothetical protein [Pirellulales bacterium]
MRGILADHDCVGDLDILVGILQSTNWIDLWASLGLEVASFADLGLTSDLPVFTVANPRRLQRESEYAEQTAVRLLEYLMDVDTFRGVGRLYMP